MLLLAGCSFDPDTKVSGGAAIDASDSMQPRDDAIAPEDCPSDIEFVLRVNGEVVTPGGAFSVVNTVLGDTVEFSAVGTCTKAGPINYTWSFPDSPDSIVGTATALDTETIRVYPVEPGDYTVELRIDDGTGMFASRGVLAFTAFGFEDLAVLATGPGSEVQDLDAGQTILWVATKAGVFQGSLFDPSLGPYQSTAAQFDEDSLAGDINAVYESPDGVYAWFGPETGDTRVFRLRLAGGEDPFVSIETIESSKARDISGSATEVVVATSKGATRATGAFNTFNQVTDGDLKAASVGPTGSFAGGMALYSLPFNTPIDIFAGGDDKIRGFADDGTHLWVGSDDIGVAKLQGTTVVEGYNIANSGLQSDKIRAMTTDATGDIWASTEAGVHRFKKDRQIWIQLSTALLTVTDNIRAVAIDEIDSRRAIYVGSSRGLAVMQIVP